MAQTTCQTCKYWNNRPGGAAAAEAKAANVTVPPSPGYCAKAAPSSTAPRWPVTDAQDFCGDYTAKATS